MPNNPTIDAQPAQPTQPRPAADPDLSGEIVRSIARNAREQVTCRRVGQNHYRCNWWSLQGTGEYDNPGMAGLLVTTSRISRSQFLRVIKTGEQLQIAIVSGRSDNDRGTPEP
jgi:hypothetical protein